MKIVKSALIVILALIMVCSSLIIVAAETTAQNDDGTTVVTISDANGGTREYEIGWKYKWDNGHLYRRRWNYTLGVWYDPYWIFVQ